MNRLLLVTGILVVALAGGALVPAIVEWLSRGALEGRSHSLMAIGILLTVGGGLAIWVGFSHLRDASLSIPPPVRAVMAANVFFLAFCSLETSDGLIRQGGRTLYWTTILFLPALALLYGQTLAHSWAWWTARILTILATLWFLAFIALIPFADVRGGGGVPAPWWGRLYMVGVSLAFASIAAYAFRSLGHTEAKEYFGLVRKA